MNTLGVIDHAEKIGVGTYAPRGMSEMAGDVRSLGAQWFYTWGASIPAVAFNAWSIGSGVSPGGIAGDNEMRLSGSSTAWATQDVRVTPGADYTLRFNGAGLAGGTGGVVIEFRDNGGTLITKNGYASVTGAEHEYIFSGSAVPNGTQTARIVAWGSTGSGISIDDVSFVSAGSEGLGNGNMEAFQQASSLPSQFVPMIFGANDVNSLSDPAKLANTNVLLGFNEPDYWAQANMTVTEALDLWPQLIATGKRLGSPGVSTSEAVGPGTWLDGFMKGAAARGYTVDFIAVHYYTTNTDVGAFKSYLEAVHNAYGKPIWVTEWSLADWEHLDRFSFADNSKFMADAMQMMDDLDFVERHAWFGTYEGLDGPSSTNLFAADGTLTQAGATFMQLTHTDPATANAANQSGPSAAPTSSAAAPTNVAPVMVSDGGGRTATVATAENMTAVTIVAATDSDDPSALSYAIVGGADAALFQIDRVSGQLSFKAAPDFEAPKDMGADNVHEVTVRASDGSLFVDQAISVRVTDVADNAYNGTARADVFAVPNSGSWAVFGGAGSDQLTGGAGNDFIDGGADNDVLKGGPGTDTLSYETASLGVTVNLALTKAQYTIGAGKDTISGFENLSGSGFSDKLSGDGSANSIFGNAGNDVITGKGGADLLDGGSGADTFVYLSVTDSTLGAMDLIRGFNTMEGNRIDLAAVDAIAGNKSRDHFTFRDGGLFTGSAGELIATEQSSGHHLVQGDVNGDWVADFAIQVESAGHLSAANFILA
jgi:hypothetical protein